MEQEEQEDQEDQEDQEEGNCMKVLLPICAVIFAIELFFIGKPHSKNTNAFHVCASMPGTPGCLPHPAEGDHTKLDIRTPVPAILTFVVCAIAAKLLRPPPIDHSRRKRKCWTRAITIAINTDPIINGENAAIVTGGDGENAEGAPFEDAPFEDNLTTQQYQDDTTARGQ